MRTFEIFPAPRFGVKSRKARNGPVGIENDDRLAAPEQESPDRAGTADEVGSFPAIDQLECRQRNSSGPNALGRHDEGKRSIGGVADERQASILGMADQQFEVGLRQSDNRSRFRGYNLYCGTRFSARQQRD